MHVMTTNAQRVLEIVIIFLKNNYLKIYKINFLFLIPSCKINIQIYKNNFLKKSKTI